MSTIVKASRVLTLSAGFVFLAACTSKVDSPNFSCIPKEAIACISADGCHGYKLCNDEGNAYGKCDCSIGSDPEGTGGRSNDSTTHQGRGGKSQTAGGSATSIGGTNAGSSTSIGGANAGSATSVGGANVGGTNAGGATSIGGTNTGGTNAGGATATTPRRTAVCDIDGANCKCHHFASLGTPSSKSYGTGTDATNEFENWLVTKTNAQISFFLTKPETLTLAWLSYYDIILLQDLRKWTLTPQEIESFQSWVRLGGGVIALSGFYSDDATEIENTNALISVSGMHLLATETASQGCTDAAALASSQLLCPNNSTSSKCYCWGNSTPLTEWNETHPVRKNVTAIGGYRGRAVDPGISGTTVLSFGGIPVGATRDVNVGKVFLFGDEFVTYFSQWINGGQKVTTGDPYNPCWDTVANTSCQSGHVYQIKQFWYNALKYVAPKTACEFAVNEPEVIP
jgi:hypothetical protein